MLLAVEQGKDKVQERKKGGLPQILNKAKMAQIENAEKEKKE